MIDVEKALIFQSIAIAALLVLVYSGGTALLIIGILYLPWLLAKIACGLVLVALVARLCAAHYVMRQF